MSFIEKLSLNKDLKYMSSPKNMIDGVYFRSDKEWIEFWNTIREESLNLTMCATSFLKQCHSLLIRFL